MANLGGTYTAGDDVIKGGGPLPKGEYVACVVKSDFKEAKNFHETGNKFIELEFEVYEGEYQGRRFWKNINLVNASAKAQEIGQREWNTILHACGKLSVSDTEEVHGIPMRVFVGFEKGNADRNDPKSFKSYNSTPSGPPAGAVQNGGASAGGAKRGPWA